jgi:hypothetical protein
MARRSRETITLEDDRWDLRPGMIGDRIRIEGTDGDGQDDFIENPAGAYEIILWERKEIDGRRKILLSLRQRRRA